MSSINNIIKKLRENRILSERKDYEEYSRDELIQMAQDGDSLALETLVKTHQKFLKKMTSKYFLATGDEDDLMQIATIAFWEAIKSWNGSGDFEAYAGMMIKRHIGSELDKESSNKSQFNQNATSMDDVVNDDGEGGQQTVGDTVSDKGADTEDQAIAKDLQDTIEDFLVNNFTAKERDVIEQYVSGYSKKEIAEAMGLTYKQVDNIIYKIKYHLKAYLRDNSYMESIRIKRGKDIEFSDEEKKILESALSNIKRREIREAKVADILIKEYDNYEDLLDQIEAAVEEIREELPDIPYKERRRSLETLEKFNKKLYAIEDDLDDQEYEYCEKIRRRIWSAEDIGYDGPEERKDPDEEYTSRGLRRSDFM